MSRFQPLDGGPDAKSAVRHPAVAGVFYPADPEECRALARSYVGPQPEPNESSPRLRGALVPHAGWICSGAIAGQAVGALARAGARPDMVVIFGAIHTPLEAAAAVLSSHDLWREPGGDSPVAGEIKAKLAEGGGLFDIDDRFYRREHAVEVELPLVQAAWPGVRILPVEVPVREEAVAVGRRVARELAAAGLSAVYLASSDLTHYGPAYEFAPAGVGPHGLAWAKDNDRRLLDLIVAGGVEGIVSEVRLSRNACGGGAISAMLAACREGGATAATVLRHASSYETLASVRAEPPTNAVGYAAVVIG